MSARDERVEEFHECVFVEEQEPSGRLVLPPCIVCELPALDALQQLRTTAGVEDGQACENEPVYTLIVNSPTRGKGVISTDNPADLLNFIGNEIRGRHYVLGRGWADRVTDDQEKALVLATLAAQALARVEALAEKFETWPDAGDAFGPRWIGQQLRAALAGGATEGSEQ